MDNTSTPQSELIDIMQQEMERYLRDEVYKKLSSINPKIEISLAFENEEFEHEGYYNTPDEAIEALKVIKDIYYE